jgi:hypothetical protein
MKISRDFFETVLHNAGVICIMKISRDFFETVLNNAGVGSYYSSNYHYYL